MCGILGAVWTAAGTPVNDEALSAGLHTLVHRGPDDSGQWRLNREDGSGVCLGHRRLSIIDLSEHGRQPLSNEDGTVHVTFNGEIYNFAELRHDLERAGHQFATDTDTEVLVHLWEEQGPAMVGRLRGMFAFAIHDARDGRLFLARDRTGQKPLLYAESEGGLLFGSELKALLTTRPQLRGDIDVRSLALYLTYQYVPHPRSIYGGVRKLPPGHTALWQDGRLDVRPYWEPPFAEEDRERTPTQWGRDLRETLTEAVRLRMVSDVPIGAFLSGGVDSSITAGLMQSLSPDPIHTFSIGFPNPQYDETAFAKLAAEKLRTNHHVHTVDPSALDTLPELIWHYDEPFADSSAVPTMYVARVARRHVTVALSGDGGDELFAGYNRYEAVRLAATIDRVPGLRAADLAAAAGGGGDDGGVGGGRDHVRLAGGGAARAAGGPEARSLGRGAAVGDLNRSRAGVFPDPGARAVGRILYYLIKVAVTLCYPQGIKIEWISNHSILQPFNPSTYGN